jgi:hypothetical protein
MVIDVPGYVQRADSVAVETVSPFCDISSLVKPRFFSVLHLRAPRSRLMGLCRWDIAVAAAYDCYGILSPWAIT